MAEPPPSSAVAAAVAEPRSKYRRSPDQRLTGMPPGVPYIIGNEAAERFSFYGMNSILVIFMTTYLMNSQGQLDPLPNNEAAAWTHIFKSAVYALPLAGAILADGVLGKYRTILWLSIVYCLGHLTLALNDTRTGLFIGLGLIAIGAGGIKPCVSAHVGDQFGRGNKHLLPKVFGWFYFAINVGSSISIYLCPILLDSPHFGPHYAFGLPGVFMLLATFVFWLGRNRFVHVPPGGMTFVRESLSREGLSALGGLCFIYLFVAIFWALWDQSNGGEWTLQAKNLDLKLFGLTLLPEQVQVVNGLYVLAFIPLFNYALYPFTNRFFPLTALRKIGIGLFLTAASFVVIWCIQLRIDAGLKPSVWWQLLAYAILTAGEVMVSITGLEFSYTQAPRRMKSFVMAGWLLTVTLGNWFTGILDFLIPALRARGFNLDGANYYLFFIGVMLSAALIYTLTARFYRGKSYLQGDEPIETCGAS
ncbi:MAG: POT family MFS transporter [Verrucomicrobia bacterium]|nr:POT family MFS transporter [Verrucomicrobiota bacterium]